LSFGGGAVAIVLLLILLSKEGFSKREQKSESVERSFARIRPYLEFGIWVISLSIAIWILGTSIAFTLFAFSYLRGYRESWLLSIAISVGYFSYFTLVLSGITDIPP